MERRRLRRMLDDRGVEVFHVGGRACVPLSEIIAKLKPLWDSVQAVGPVPEEDDSDPEWAE
jgi:hypothetical protein